MVDSLKGNGLYSKLFFALILLPDFTISKFESELCMSGTDFCHLNWLFISWYSASCCLGRVLSVPAHVCPIWWDQRTHSWVVSSGEMIFLLGKWILAQTFYWFVYPASCTRAALEIHEFLHNTFTAKTCLSLAVYVQLIFCHRLL